MTPLVTSRAALAVSRYLAADLLRSQRFLLPVLAYLTVVMVLMGGDPGPPPQLWGASVGLLYPISAWLTIVVANAEDPSARHVTVTAAGGWLRVQIGVLITCLGADLILLAAAVLRPLLPLGGTPYPYTPRMLLIGALAHLAAAGAGTALGLLFGPPIVARIGWSAVATGLAVLMTVTQPWLPPVGTAIRTLEQPHQPLLGLALGAAFSVLIAGLACATVVRIAPRRS
ncbi:hypothetical protein [Pseudonocardia spinosispora]|uniref:hypothetical protein n=1 Tax=Pseudonocardia spinosispora TaxID=103441 RepID=UPI00040E9501|nr:hypothetical protein [Pseudonocardia spinosispora]